LGREPEALAERWGQRQKEVSERLGSGDLISVAEVVRDMTHAACLRRPSASDRELCETAHGLLEAELLAVLGDSASADIERVLSEGSTAAR
jgi:RNA polymerase-interacting CarD/CdnL/TRCF family regulator